MGCATSKASQEADSKPKVSYNLDRQPTMSKFEHAQSAATAKFAASHSNKSLSGEGSPERKPKTTTFSDETGVNMETTPTHGGFDTSSKADISKERPERQSSRRASKQDISPKVIQDI